MFQLKLVLKSRGDAYPTVNTNDLIKAGLLKKAPKSGEKVELRLVSTGGQVAVQDFYASRDGATLYAKEGFNDYLFDLPSIGNPINVGCAGLVAAASGLNTSSSSSRQAAPSPGSRPTGLSAITKLINSFPTKVAAAASIGVSADTLRRMLTKAQEEAKLAARSAPKKTSGFTSGKTKSSFSGGSQKKAAPARSASTGRPSKRELQSALRTYGTKAAAADALGTNPRTFGRWLEAAGL